MYLSLIVNVQTNQRVQCSRRKLNAHYHNQMQTVKNKVLHLVKKVISICHILCYLNFAPATAFEKFGGIPPLVKTIFVNVVMNALISSSRL